MADKDVAGVVRALAASRGTRRRRGDLHRGRRAPGAAGRRARRALGGRRRAGHPDARRPAAGRGPRRGPRRGARSDGRGRLALPRRRDPGACSSTTRRCATWQDPDHEAGADPDRAEHVHLGRADLRGRDRQRHPRFVLRRRRSWRGEPRAAATQSTGPWRRRRAMVAEGADLLDIGGESTRPGPRPVGRGRGARPDGARCSGRSGRPARHPAEHRHDEAGGCRGGDRRPAPTCSTTSGASAADPAWPASRPSTACP